MQKTTLAIFAALAVSGCDTWETSSLPKDLPPVQTEQTTAPSSVVVTSDSMANRSYSSLGELSVSVNKTTALHPAPTEDMVIRKLQEDASKLGAIAVVNAKISDVKISALSWGTRTGTGTAVRLSE